MRKLIIRHVLKYVTVQIARLPDGEITVGLFLDRSRHEFLGGLAMPSRSKEMVYTLPLKPRLNPFRHILPKRK